MLTFDYFIQYHLLLLVLILHSDLNLLHLKMKSDTYIFICVWSFIISHQSWINKWDTTNSTDSKAIYQTMNRIWQRTVSSTWFHFHYFDVINIDRSIYLNVGISLSSHHHHHHHPTTPSAYSQGSRCQRVDNTTAVSRAAKELKGPRGWIKPISSCQSPRHIMTMCWIGFTLLCLLFLVFPLVKLDPSLSRGLFCGSSLAGVSQRVHSEDHWVARDNFPLLHTRTDHAPNIN